MPQMKKNISKNNFFWNAVFHLVALTFSIALSLFFYNVGFDSFASFLMGVIATVSVAIICSFLNWAIWLIAMRITRGIPFCVGDYVEFTSGEYQGELGQVKMVIEGRYAVVVTLKNILF